MTKIKTLTKEQEAQLAVYRDRWIAIERSTEPADRERAEAGIVLAYKSAGLASPERIVWCGSPMALVLAHADMKDKGQVMAFVGASVGDPNKSDSIGNSIGASVWELIEDEEPVGASLWASIWDLVKVSVENSARGAIFWGQHDAHWLGFYEFFREVLKLQDETQPMVGLMEVAKSAGWWIPCEGICFVSERHSELHFDDQGQLHSTAGPAVLYPDGWAVYAVHGE